MNNVCYEHIMLFAKINVADKFKGKLKTNNFITDTNIFIRLTILCRSLQFR